MREIKSSKKGFIYIAKRLKSWSELGRRHSLHAQMIKEPIKILIVKCLLALGLAKKKERPERGPGFVRRMR